MLLSLLSNYSNPILNDQLFNELIQFGIYLLNDGNREVQKSVYAYFQNFMTSEVFFMRLHSRIHDEINVLKRDQREETPPLFKFEQEQDVIQNILRFMQLFAEGHYLDLQNYMRQQTQNYHNYDLIQDVIELLNNYFKKIQPQYIDNMMQSFDTLTEYIQGPCYENQIALIQDNFLDLASNLLQIDEIMDHYNYKMRLQ